MRENQGQPRPVDLSDWTGVNLEATNAWEKDVALRPITPNLANDGSFCISWTTARIPWFRKVKNARSHQTQQDAQSQYHAEHGNTPPARRSGFAPKTGSAARITANTRTVNIMCAATATTLTDKQKKQLASDSKQFSMIYKLFSTDFDTKKAEIKAKLNEWSQDKSPRGEDGQPSTK
eukprot:3151521-Pyramimonas_sp.AAC.1